MIGRSYRKLPGGIKGINLVMTAQQIAAGNGWAQFWKDFDWSGSPTSINGQIRFAKSLGANAIRIIGSGGSGLWAGAYTQSQYLARQSQVIAFCQTLGMSYYLTVGGQNEYQGYKTAPGGDGTETGFGAIVAWTSALVASAAKFPNVIGVDLCQETFGLSLFGMESGPGNKPTTAQVVSLMSQLRTASHAIAPDLPVTFSWTTNASYRLPSDNSNAFDLCAQYSDYIDRHIYYDPASSGVPADQISLASCIGKQTLIGEHGMPASSGESARSSQLDAIRSQLINSSSINCVGGFAWTAIPQDTPGGSDDYGLGDLSGTARASGSHYATFPGLPRSAAFDYPRRRRLS